MLGRLPRVAGSRPFGLWRNSPFPPTYIFNCGSRAAVGRGREGWELLLEDLPLSAALGGWRGGVWPASRRAHTGMMLEAKAGPADVALSPAADHKIWLKFSLRPLLIIFWDR